jgi:TPR repeat protein
MLWRQLPHVTAKLAAMVCIAAAAFSVPAARADTTAGLNDFQAGRFAEALVEWQQSADAGDANGALYIGVLYDTGEGVPQDYITALRWYERAANDGSAAASFNVGVLYDVGLGVLQDRRQAAFWYKRAAERGFGRASYNLALLYNSGGGVPRDRALAGKLFSAAAHQGISAARPHLPREQSQPASRGQLQDVAMRDFQLAQNILLGRGVNAAAKAVVLFRRSAEQGNPLAEYDLGYCYEHGIGTQPDLDAAGEWYRRAAAHTDGVLRDNALKGIQNVDATRTAQGERQLAPPPVN